MTTPPTDHPESASALERAAGELTSAMTAGASPDAALPPALAAQIIADGERQVRAARVVDLRAHSARRARAGWLVAAAAVLAWVLVPNPWAARRTREAAAPPAALRDSLLADASSVRAAWAPSTDPAARGASGDVTWNARTQRGVLRFRGLAPNDPRSAQYQLWIIDAARDARYPVDGGVFDVGSDGEVLVRVQARLPVTRPTLFAVTLERPGGVVVSTRERLVLAAPVGG